MTDNIQTSSRPGYILILVLMFIAATLIIVNQLFQEGQTHLAFTKTMLEREKAKLLANSGVSMGLSVLQEAFTAQEAPHQKAETKKKEEFAQERKVIETLFPYINRWQTIVLNQARDSISGEIKICICCEDGKLNLNTLFDFKKKKFIGAGKAEGNIQELMKMVMQRLRDESGGKDLFTPLLDFLAKRGYQLNEVTELVVNEFFERAFKEAIFYEPTQKGERQRGVYLTDLFTIWSDSIQLEPRFLSNSVCAAFGLQRPAHGDFAALKNQGTKLAQQFKQKIDWKIEWDKSLKNIYNKSFTALPKDSGLLFSTTFKPTAFSIIASGKVGRIEQRVFAIAKKEQLNKKAIMKIVRVYWI